MRVNPEDFVVGWEANLMVLDFWKWAFSDLCDDDIKGWYAEWMVGKILGIDTPRRISWANSDLIAGDVRIEVKASSYWQSWKLLDEFGAAQPTKPLAADCAKRVRFGGLIAGDSVHPNGPVAGLKSDLYVFAFQKEQEPDRWNALDLSQWDFYLLDKSQLASRSISLVDLGKLCSPMTAEQLKEKGRRRIEELQVKKIEPCTKAPIGANRIIR